MINIQSLLKYGLMAMNAVMQVQAEVGASNGDGTVQLTKKQLAIAYVLAAAHAGEQVANAKIQQISAIVDMQARLASVLGLFGKTPDLTGAVQVPPADQIKLTLQT